MYFFGMAGFSKESAAGAISNAIGMARADFGPDAHSVHIIVTNVFKTEEGWRAIVRIVVEPDLELEDKKDKKQELAYDAHLEDLEAKREKQRRYELEMFEDMEELVEANMEEANVFVFMPAHYEEYYMDLMEQTPEPAFMARVIEDGPLWDNVQTILLDNDFYEATHYMELKKRYSGSGAWSPQKIYEYSEEAPEQDLDKPVQDYDQKQEMKLRQKALLDELVYGF